MSSCYKSALHCIGRCKGLEQQPKLSMSTESNSRHLCKVAVEHKTQCACRSACWPKDVHWVIVCLLLAAARPDVKFGV